MLNALRGQHNVEARGAEVLGDSERVHLEAFAADAGAHFGEQRLPDIDGGDPGAAPLQRFREESEAGPDLEHFLAGERIAGQEFFDQNL